MTQFRYLGKIPVGDGHNLRYLTVDMTGAITVQDMCGGYLPLSFIATPTPPLQFALEDAVRSFYIHGYGRPGSYECWTKAKERILEALAKYGKPGIVWEEFTP